MASKKSETLKKIPDNLVNTEALSSLLNITTRQIQNLVQGEKIPRVSPGKFSLIPAVNGYIKYLKEINENQTKTASSSRVQEARALEIERKIAREDRQIIMLDEAMGVLDAATGEFLAALTGLPAEITRDIRERKRIEGILDNTRNRLSERFAKIQSTLETGEEETEADEEDNS